MRVTPKAEEAKAPEVAPNPLPMDIDINDRDLDLDTHNDRITLHIAAAQDGGVDVTASVALYKDEFSSDKLLEKRTHIPPSQPGWKFDAARYETSALSLHETSGAIESQMQPVTLTELLPEIPPTGLGSGGMAEGLGGLGTKGRGSGASGYGSGGGNFGSKGEGGIGTVGADPIILGSLDKSLIDAVIKRNMSQVRYCYQRELTRNPSLGGKITVKFSIAKDGSVPTLPTIVSSTMNNTAVEDCLCERFQKFQFPEPKGGGIVVVRYPFIFSPG